MSKKILQNLSSINYIKLHYHLIELYKQYNCPSFIHPDPLEFVHRYSDPNDQEIAGLFAALLAYGRVGQILKSTEKVLGVMGASPREYITRTKTSQLEVDFKTFQHRWTRGNDIVHLVQGIKHLLENYSTLEESFSSQLKTNSVNTLSALGSWSNSINPYKFKNSLLSDPEKGSACKRLHLYLRWMIRRDNVDPGPWTTVSPSLLLIPLDTHMFNIAKELDMTKRSNPDVKAVIDITNVFKVLEPDDPVKFDFALTRLGIRSEADINLFLDKVHT